ncbi:essential cytoplasmic protein [Ophiostoma piceae UAMH 11346]|uniref:Ataxin-10 homolog n=1 Tax=Ophiostoma piceae (strain UAMH 11346) TaxID=1262450 RepID=S3CHG5_OPHP1|nr:essential cytoplasmic protein [Ophiostoma piceae UAMH 11346]
MSPMAIGNVPPIDRISAPSGEDSIEEVCFIAALICLDGHFDCLPSIPGPQTQQKVAGMVARTLEKTHSRKDVRESLARNVEIWVYLTRIFNNAIDNLTSRSVASMSDASYDDKNGGGGNNGPANGHNNGHGHLHGHGGHDNSELMIRNHASLKEDLQILNKLMHIARNLLVCTDPEVPQDICAAVSFDAVVFQIIVLCVNLAGKGYHGEVADEPSRAKLNEIYDLFKKLLVTSLQQVHNWTAKNDRNKTAFWYYVFFEDESMPDDIDAISHDGTDYRLDIAKVDMKRWLERNATICDEAKSRLVDYANTHQSKAPGIPSLNTPLARLWIPNHLLEPDDDMPELTNRTRQDAFLRMSNEAEVWWQLVRDPNSLGWRQPMPDREYGKRRQKFFSEILESRFSSGWRLRDENRVQGYGANMPHKFFGLLSPAQEAELSAEYGGHYGTALPHDQHQEERVVEEVDEDYEDDEDEDDDEDDEDGEDLEEEEVEEADEEYDVHSQDQGRGHRNPRHDRRDGHPYADIHGDDFNEEEEEEDDEEDEEDEEDDLDNDSYTEGPVLGLLTEIPNLLDPKQIEALHMIVKSCILDSMGNGPTPSGESLQQSRCKIFLASESGRSLLRELLVFVAVWDQGEVALIWDITAQVMQAIHDASLVPYAWTELRIPKDVVSPAQAVMLRMITFLFRCRYLNYNPKNDRAVAKSGGGDEDEDEDAQSAPPPRRPYSVKVDERDIKLVHFLFTSVRCRIVPECLAFMTYQGDIRRGVINPDNFPVETWDMERARDGLSQVLEFITMLCEIDEIRAKLVEWGAASEIIMLLKGLEDAVPKKPLVDATQAAAAIRNGPASRGAQQNGQHESSPPPPPVPQDPAYKFPWGGIKTQALAILASLLQPPPGRMSPGNEMVQNQIMEEKGMVPLLNACVYDDHNRFARERVQLCLKYLMDGCDEANLFVRELVKTAPPQRAAAGTGPPNPNTITRLRVDGVEGEVKVQVRSEKAAEERAAAMARGAPAPVFSEEDARAAAVYSTSDRPVTPAGSASGQNTAAASAAPLPATNPPNPPLGTARQRKQRQKRQQRQQRQKLQEALEAHEAHQQAQNQQPPQPSQPSQSSQTSQSSQQPQAHSQAPQQIPQEIPQQQQQQPPPPPSPQAQAGSQQQGQSLPPQQPPLPATPRVFGPPPPPPAIPSLASLAAHLPPLPAGHPFQHGHLPATHPLAQPIVGQQSQQPMSAKTAEALAARRARCEALLGEIISLSDHTARMALSIERGEMPPLPDDTLMNFLKSQKFLERCRDRLTRPINGPPDALVEDGSNLTTSMLADPLGSLFSGLGVSGPAGAGPAGVPVGATSLEDQYRLVEQALLYLTEDLAKSSELSHLVR